MRDKRPLRRACFASASLLQHHFLYHQNMFNCFSDPIVRLKNRNSRAQTNSGYGHIVLLNRRIISYSDRMRMEHVVVEAAL